MLAEDNSWVQYVMADSHFEFPCYPLDHDVPSGLPLINFAEISIMKDADAAADKS